eukprot:1956457-Pyramimonas_sp.AAC.1
MLAAVLERLGGMSLDIEPKVRLVSPERGTLQCYSVTAILWYSGSGVQLYSGTAPQCDGHGRSCFVCSCMLRVCFVYASYMFHECFVYVLCTFRVRFVYAGGGSAADGAHSAAGHGGTDRGGGGAGWAPPSAARARASPGAHPPRLPQPRHPPPPGGPPGYAPQDTPVQGVPVERPKITEEKGTPAGVVNRAQGPVLGSWEDWPPAAYSVYILSPSAIGARYGYILSPLPQLVPAM